MLQHRAPLYLLLIAFRRAKKSMFVKDENGLTFGYEWEGGRNKE